MNNYNHYRDRDDFAHRNNMPPPKPELRTPVSNRSDFARASIPTNSTTARTSRMAEPSRNSVAAGFGSRPSIAHRPSLAPRNSIVTGSLSGRMSMLPVNYKRIPQMLLNRPAMLNIPKNTQDKGHVANMCNRIYEFLQISCSDNWTTAIYSTPKKYGRRGVKTVSSTRLSLYTQKSAMATMGAQHSWPTLLTALNWLITLIEEHYDLNESLVKDEFHLTYSYFTTCYRKSAEREKHGVDCDFSDELEIYRNLLQPQDMDEEIANRKANRLNNEKIIQQMKEDVEREHEECRNLMAENADLENDIIKLKDNVEASEVTVSRQEEFIVSAVAA
uniref:Kinetochore protein NDC80 n=1 Tax=Ditylenchus dipsaci TaxID=166011 RepID=A0A915EJQ5_9BILA